MNVNGKVYYNIEKPEKPEEKETKQNYPMLASSQSYLPSDIPLGFSRTNYSIYIIIQNKLIKLLTISCDNYKYFVCVYKWDDLGKDFGQKPNWDRLFTETFTPDELTPEGVKKAVDEAMKRFYEIVTNYMNEFEKLKNRYNKY